MTTLETFGSSIRIERFFETGYSIHRSSFEKDASGGVVNSWVKLKDIVGRISKRTRSSSTLYYVINDKMTEDPNFRFYCGMEDIQPGDEIRKDDKRYLVLFVDNVMTMNRFLQVELRLVDKNDKNI